MKQEIYKGNSKFLYRGEDDAFILSFSDQINLGHNSLLEVSGKGVINNSISSFIMQKLDAIGIENHFIKKLNMREQIIQPVEILPIIVSVSIVACDRYVTDFKMEEGYVFDLPIIEFKVKNKELKYPVINEHQMLHFGWLSNFEIKDLKKTTIRIFDFLTGLFIGIGIRLVECNLEFGRIFDGEDFGLILADEVTPDNCKLWDLSTNHKLGLEGVLANPSLSLECYQKIFNRLNSYGLL